MRTAFLCLVVLAASSSGSAQDVDVPLQDWTVPRDARSESGGVTTMTDATPPRLFIGIQPCRVADTRGNGAPIQGGILNAAETRTWDLTGICGIPAGADAISGNFTVTGAPTAPPGSFILAWPNGGPIPPVSILNFQAGQTIANAAIVPLGAGEQINVNTSATVHVILDVNGYFSDRLQTPANYLSLFNNSNTWTARFTNESSTCDGTCGVIAAVASGNAFVATSSEGTADVNTGVWGSVDSTGTNSAGVRGLAGNSGGVTFGVWGRTSSSTGGAAGVFGSAGLVLSNFNYSTPVGMMGRADDNETGIVGTAENENGWGVQGFRLNQTTGAVATSGVLGYAGNSGVHAFQDVTAGGLKPFVVPYDGDASKQIVFVAIEADEALTATRGRIRLAGGLGKISVPDHFLRVTEPEGWTVQLTPIGQMATVAVVRMDPALGEITVQASRSVEVFYRIEGVRKGYKDFQPVQQNLLFVPQSATSTMPAWPELTKQQLIKNGIYREDGTVIMETARRLGWDKIWEERSRPAPRPAEP